MLRPSGHWRDASVPRAIPMGSVEGGRPVLPNGDLSREEGRRCDVREKDRASCPLAQDEDRLGDGPAASAAGHPGPDRDRCGVDQERRPSLTTALARSCVTGRASPSQARGGLYLYPLTRYKETCLHRQTSLTQVKRAIYVGKLPGGAGGGGRWRPGPLESGLYLGRKGLWRTRAAAARSRPGFTLRGTSGEAHQNGSWLATAPCCTPGYPAADAAPIATSIAPVDTPAAGPTARHRRREAGVIYRASLASWAATARNASSMLRVAHTWAASWSGSGARIACRHRW
jgi:hypothetical protein